MIGMNSLANSLPLNGKTTGQLSNQYPNLFVPAGITFSIWGLIYLLLLLFVIKKGLEIFNDRNSNVSLLVIINFILSGLWIVFWHYEFLILSLVVTFSLLTILILHNYSLRAMKHNYLEKMAFGIYLGWICVATIANFTAVLVNFKWDGFGFSESVWTIIMITIGTMIGALVTNVLKNPFVALVIIWAFLGIYLKISLDEIPITNIIYVLYFGIGFLFLTFTLKQFVLSIGKIKN